MTKRQRMILVIFSLVLGMAMSLSVTPVAAQTCPHDGDVNGDGTSTTTDALLAFQHFLGTAEPPLDACQQDQANVENPGAGVITPTDALCILQKFLGVPSCLDEVIAPATIAEEMPPAIATIDKDDLTNDPNQFIVWDVTGDVQAFLDGEPHYGWLVKDHLEDIPGTYKTEWVSKESGEAVCEANSAPRLLVETSAGPILITTPEADTSLDQNSPNKNTGAESRLLVISQGVPPESNWRFLVRFDLSQIPEEVTIDRAELQLCLDKISGDQSTRVYEARRITIPWEENEATANQASNGAPWNFGDFATIIPRAYVNKDVLGTAPNRFLGWEVTEDVRAFRDGVPNNGWLVKDDNENLLGTYKTEWVSRESGSTACGVNSAPRLLVETSAGPILITTPEADASLDENSANMNRGAEPQLLAISWKDNNWRFLVRFDLAAIPAEATIDRAVLQLCLVDISGDQSRRVYEAHRVTLAWQEDQVTTNQAATGVPWGFGDFGFTVPRAHVNKDVLGTAPNRFIEWDVSEDVRAFRDGVPNNGWLVKDRDEEKEGEYRTEWVSRESGEAVCEANSAPQLLVETSVGPILITTPEADTSLDQNSPNKNTGAESRLLAVSRGNPPESNWRFLVRFDLAVIPAEATIVDATLQLCLDKISGDQSRRVYEAHRVTLAWLEDQATTNQAAEGIPWGFGDFGFTVPRAHVNKDVLGTAPTRFIEWDVSEDVQAFRDGVPNNGWLVKDRDEEKEGEYRTEWVSRESGVPVCEANSAPRLLVETDIEMILIDKPEADASLDQNSPNMNRGATPDLLAVSRGDPPESNWRFLVRFDLAVIPAEATIVDATLQLCLDKISGDQSRRVYEAHRATLAWVEDEVAASRAANGVLWNFGFE